MSTIDDYDLYDLDFEEWCRRGREAFGLHPSTESTKACTPSIYENDKNIPSQK